MATPTTDRVLGVVALAATAALAWAVFSPYGNLIHVAIALLTILACGGAIGSGILSRRRMIAPSVSAEQLKRLAEERPIPFGVCTDCRIIIELPHVLACPQCGSTDRCVAVGEESERSIAIASIGVD